MVSHLGDLKAPRSPSHFSLQQDHFLGLALAVSGPSSWQQAAPGIRQLQHSAECCRSQLRMFRAEEMALYILNPGDMLCLDCHV